MPCHATRCEAVRHTRRPCKLSASRPGQHGTGPRSDLRGVELYCCPLHLPLTTTAYTVSRRRCMCKHALRPGSHVQLCARGGRTVRYDLTSRHRANLHLYHPGHMTSTCALHLASHRIALAKASQPALIARRSSVQVESRPTASTAPSQRSEHARGLAVSGSRRSVSTSKREG